MAARVHCKINTGTLVAFAAVNGRMVGPCPTFGTSITTPAGTHRQRTWTV